MPLEIHMRCVAAPDMPASPDPVKVGEQRVKPKRSARATRLRSRSDALRDNLAGWKSPRCGASIGEIAAFTTSTIRSRVCPIVPGAGVAADRDMLAMVAMIGCGRGRAVRQCRHAPRRSGRRAAIRAAATIGILGGAMRPRARARAGVWRVVLVPLTRRATAGGRGIVRQAMLRDRRRAATEV